MASRLKEDEKNERIIRGLLKLPENKRCINCNSLGPQYVCTTFWTFVCTNCSGIHREFTHRVKSISMAKFTSQEVSALQGGGNQCARDIYFKGLDPQRQSLPDGSNVERLRDFIRHVYVNKRYACERNDEKPPKGKMGDKGDFHENRSPSESRSPRYEDTYERRSDRSSPEGRSPGYEPKYGDYGKSPSRAEVVNDWRRDDRFGSGRKSEDEGRSPENGKDIGSSSPPVARPVREILRDSVVPLRISEPPKAGVSRAADSSADFKVQQTASSSLASTNEKTREVKLETTVSLIDFDADPEPPAPTAATQAQQSTTLPQAVQQPTTSAANDNWASFDVAPSVNVSQAPSNTSTLDSLLSELSVPASAPPVQSSRQPSGPGASVDGTAFPGNPPVAIAGNNNALSPFGTGSSNLSSVPAGGQWPNVQHQQPSLFPIHVGHSVTQHFSPPQNGNSSNQSCNASLASNVHRSLSAPTLQPLQAVSNPVQEVASGGLQPSYVEQKSIGRKELPEDLFSGTYPSYNAQVQGWQAVPPRGMGFSMHYGAAAMPFQAFQQPAKSANPFDLNNDQPPQTQTFPSMAPLQGALPNTSPPLGLLRTSSLDSASPALIQSQTPPRPSGMPPKGPAFHPLVMPPRYMPPQMPSNVAPSHMGSFSNVGASFGTQSKDQQLPGPFSAPPNPHSFPSVGNPFG